MGQREIILNRLLSGERLTVYGAIHNDGIYRLSAIIYSLRKEGIPIITFNKRARVELGERPRNYAVYYIPKEHLMT